MQDMAEKTIAIIGASTDRSKYGNAAVRTYLDQGWTVYPINPKADAIEGTRAYASVRDVPDEPARVAVYVPPKVLIGLLDDIAAKRPGEVWLNPGTESGEVLAKARELGLNVIQACSIVDRGVSPAKYLEA
jgi:predicted CoA-binding protein